jgi:hypothetical protein
MERVKLDLGGTEYTKEAPTIEDWLFNLEISPRIEGKNLLSDADAALAAVEVVAKYLHVSVEEAIAYGDLLATLEAYHTIQKNIVTAFAQAHEVWGKNVDAPAK